MSIQEPTNAPTPVHTEPGAASRRPASSTCLNRHYIERGALALLLGLLGCGEDRGGEQPTDTDTIGVNGTDHASATSGTPPCATDDCDTGTYGGVTTLDDPTEPAGTSTSTGDPSDTDDDDPLPCPPLLEPELSCGDGVADPDELCLLAPQSYEVGARPSALALTDVNADGRLDVLVASRAQHRVDVLRSGENGALKPALAVALYPDNVLNHLLGGEPTAIAVGDIVGSAAPELVSVNALSKNWSILIGTGAEDAPLELLDTLTIPTFTPSAVFIGDLNEDGRADLVLAGEDDDGPRVDVVMTDLGLSSLEPPPGLRPDRLASADLDGDGRVELVLASIEESQIAIFRVGADPLEFEFLGALGPLSAGPPIALASADLDGDGVDALLVAHADPSCEDGDPDSCTADRVSVYDQLLTGASAGSGALDGTHSSRLVGLGARSLALGDLNGDEAPDVVVGNAVSGDISVLLGDGAGGFAACLQRVHDHGPGDIRVALGDFNKDGVDDLVTAHAATATVELALSWP